VHIKIKPLSANEAFAPRGVKAGKVIKARVYKTEKYNEYERKLLRSLPDLVIPEGKLQLNVIVRYSSSRSDIDNCLKPFIDVLQKRYKFNDNRIYKLVIIKYVTSKDEEGISFQLKEYIEVTDGN
jgi:Holliday junction resolvase RusA-like endonuclease